MGYSVWCQPLSKVYHLGGATLDNASPRKTYLNFRNNLATLRSNLPLLKFMGILWVRVIFDFVASIRFLVGNGPSHFLAVIRAYLLFPGIKANYKTNRTGRIRGIMKTSIVIGYYVRKVRKFSELRGF